MEKQLKQNSGRVTNKENRKRVHTFLKFVFLFKFVFKNQLQRFAHIVLGVNNPRRLLETCLKDGLVGECFLPLTGQRKVYFLKNPGLDCLDDELPLVHYRFRKENVNLISIPHSEAVMKAYIFLIHRFPASQWVSEWILRIGKKKHVRLPDGLFVLEDGTKLAIEVERTHKSLPELREVVGRFSANFQTGSCHGVLIIAEDSYVFRTIMRRIFHLIPSVSGRYFFVTTFALLAQDKVFQGNRELSLNEMLNLLSEGKDANEN